MKLMIIPKLPDTSFSVVTIPNNGAVSTPSFNEKISMFSIIVSIINALNPDTKNFKKVFDIRSTMNRFRAKFRNCIISEIFYQHYESNPTC
jgi:hypothetical protein